MKKKLKELKNTALHVLAIIVMGITFLAVVVGSLALVLGVQIGAAYLGAFLMTPIIDLVFPAVTFNQVWLGLLVLIVVANQFRRR